LSGARLAPQRSTKESKVNQTEIYPKLTAIFQEVLFDDELTLTPMTTADDVDGWDSLAHIRLVLAVSKAFNVKFSASEIGNLKNVGELVTLIETKVPT
jgi:acyl carrier protein